MNNKNFAKNDGLIPDFFYKNKIKDTFKNCIQIKLIDVLFHFCYRICNFFPPWPHCANLILFFFQVLRL